MKIVTMCCTTCPSSCPLTVTIEDNQVTLVEGNTCKRGELFAQNEWVNPIRILTSTVCANINGKEMLIPVKTREAISKSKINKAMDEIRDLKVDHTVRMGDVLLENIAGTGTDLIACRTFE